jgi:hypothetical protein
VDRLVTPRQQAAGLPLIRTRIDRQFRCRIGLYVTAFEGSEEEKAQIDYGFAWAIAAPNSAIRRPAE